MNYEPNTQEWRKGDIVLHDGDEKSPQMLMKIIGFSRDGRVKTQYVDQRRTRRIWKNPISYLHDPNRFGINPDLGNRRQEFLVRYQTEWVNCRIWNVRYQPGMRVKTTSDDGGFEAITTGKAIYNAAGYGQVHLAGHGNWALEFVEPVVEEAARDLYTAV